MSGIMTAREAPLRGTDAVATLSPFTRETRRLSDGHVDGVEATWSREDAIFTKLKFGKVRKRTLRQHQMVDDPKQVVDRIRIRR